MEFSDLDSSRYGIEEILFFDRRIMEFCLAVPGKYRIKDGKTRYYFRQAMEGYLDNEILNRFSKANISPIAINSLKQVDLEYEIFKENNMSKNSRQKLYYKKYY